jgi:hypothetical protein
MKITKKHIGRLNKEGKYENQLKNENKYFYTDQQRKKEGQHRGVWFEISWRW